MKKIKSKVGVALFMVALLAAGATKVQAINAWRLDIENGVQIDPADCDGFNSNFCAQVYNDGDTPESHDEPTGQLTGNYLGN